uniref:Uncharacterized protein n=1 Tax=Anguilla anguilla TaxID=7936 RepID=A0A0E9SI22_ANGAN
MLHNIPGYGTTREIFNKLFNYKI